MTPEQKLEAIREELSIYIERLEIARVDMINGPFGEDEWPDYEAWAREGAPVDLEKIVEILDSHEY